MIKVAMWIAGALVLAGIAFAIYYVATRGGANALGSAVSSVGASGGVSYAPAAYHEDLHASAES